MIIDFRIDWGYQYLYSRRHYHPWYLWDGRLECSLGKILKLYRLEYPVLWFGPGHSAREIPLRGTSWEDRTRRGFSGIRVLAEVSENTVFSLKTISADITFRAADLAEKGRLDFPVGPKYLNCCVSVTKSGYLWFRKERYEGWHILEAKDMPLSVHSWSRMNLAWLPPQGTLTWTCRMEESRKDFSELLIHLVAMAVPEYTADRETQVDAVMPLELFCDGISVLKFERHYRFHDKCLQLLEDDWQRIPASPGEHTLTLKNDHPEYALGISRILTKQCGFAHGQLSVPEWALAGETVFGKVFAAFEGEADVRLPGMVLNISCRPGWNEFPFRIDQGGLHRIETATDQKEIEIFDAEEEAHPVRVGFDMTVVPHDDNGFMDWLLDYVQRTRLGNYVVFRSFTGTPADTSLERWGAYCRDHNISVAACRDFQNGVLARASGAMFHDCGCHEYSGKVYWADPAEPYASDDMKEASEKYVAYLREELDSYHKICDCAAFGDASGAIRYSFLAGADFVRAETMVGNTMTLLSQARPAAESLGKGRWGVHIAIQHHATPYHENHLGQYFLSLMQPWMMGAEVIYEEDSLFCLFKEERQAWDDLLTKGKRDMTRLFYKFVKTHPRRGRNVRKIAFLEGRYAAPFNGFIAGSEQDPHYSVWGMFGSEKAEWGHLQPEKCRQLLDVLMPGASTHPLRQKFDKRRFFFAGTPFGDFDCTPIEAAPDYLDRYGLLLNLGWNTMLAEDYEKLKNYAASGGILLTGLMQFSTHTKRDFLKDMEEPAFFRNGSLEELCGIRVNGKGTAYCGEWNSRNRESIIVPELASAPSDSPAEDGDACLADVTLTGAEIVAWDGASGKPMLVKNRVGSGCVYTFTIWAYPGHEAFQPFCASWVRKLAEEVCRADGKFVSDASNEIFWTVWEDGDATRFMLLNTDWTVRGNEKPAEVHYNGRTISVRIKERTAVFITCRNEDIQTDTYDCNHA